MDTFKKVFAVITIKDGRPVIDLCNTAKYMVVSTKDGITCIVEREPLEYIAIELD